LKLKTDELHSDFAFDFNLRRYTEDLAFNRKELTKSLGLRRRNLLAAAGECGGAWQMSTRHLKFHFLDRKWQPMTCRARIRWPRHRHASKPSLLGFMPSSDVAVNIP